MVPIGLHDRSYILSDVLGSRTSTRSSTDECTFIAFRGRLAKQDAGDDLSKGESADLCQPPRIDDLGSHRPNDLLMIIFWTSLVPP